MSSASPAPPSFQIRRPIEPVIIGAALTLLVLAAALELLARNDQVTAGLFPPSINGDPGIATRLETLDRMIARSGPPDCFFVGNSMVHHDINPPLVDDAYKAAAHQPLKCFNFGLRASNALGALRMASYLVRQYHPRLLVYGAGFRDFIDDDHNLDIPWMRFQDGEWSPEGWLETNSYAYRYAVTYRAVLREGRQGVTMQAVRENLSTAEGFREGKQSADLSVVDRAEWKDYIHWSKAFALNPDLLAAFDNLLALQASGTRVIVLEMPFAPGIYDRLPSGMQTHNTFAAAVSARAARHGVAFWPTLGVVALPDDDWSDPFHLDTAGAGVFSKFVGERLAAGSAAPAD